MWPFKERKWQLVIEFPGGSPEEFKKLAALQEEMDDHLTSGEVDGNDVGSGFMNIYIMTKSLNRCWGEAMMFVGKHGMRPSGAGARDLKKEGFIRLWPKGEKRPFSLR